MIGILFLMGLGFGSFVNMLVYRTAVAYGLRKKIKVKNEKCSFCDWCGERLKWSDNIPVVSWLALGGKTSCCRKKLPKWYPIVELTMGIMFAVYWLRFEERFWQGEILAGILGLIMVVFLVFSVVFDLKYMILPDFSTLILVVLAVGQRWLAGGEIVPYLVAMGVGGGFIGLLYLFTEGRGMGLGDVKLAVYMGLLLGWPGVVAALYIAFVCGGVVAGVLLVSGRVKRKSLIPFGPFLVAGTMASWWFERLWGNTMPW